MFATDAAAFLADTGELVSWTDSVTDQVHNGSMLFDQPDADVQSGSAISREFEVTFELAAWPGLRRGEVLTISGAGGNLHYILRTDPRQGDDAVFSSVRLTKKA